MRKNFLLRLALALTFASSQVLMAAKVKIVVEAPAKEKKASEEPLTRSVHTPSPAVAPAGVAAALQFDKIIQKSSATGSAVYLAPINPANPLAFSLVQVVPQVAANGAISFNITGLAKEHPTTLNGVKEPMVPGPGGVPAAGVPYTNPLFDTTLTHVATLGDDIVAVPANDPDKIIAVSTTSPDQVVSTADRNAAAVRPAVLDFTPLKDAAGADVNTAIRALATDGASTVFAAVSTNGQPFTADSLSRGVASVTKNNTLLVQAAHAAPLTFTAVDGDAVARLTLARLNALFGVAGVNNAIRAILVGAIMENVAATVAYDAGSAAIIAGLAAVPGNALVPVAIATPVAVAIGANIHATAVFFGGGVAGNLSTTDDAQIVAGAQAIANAAAGAATPQLAAAVKAAVLAAAQGGDALAIFTAANVAQAAFDGAVVGAGALQARATLNRQLASSGVVMHYSPELKRLFVGYKNLRKDAVANQGGLSAIMVGQPGGTFSSILHAPSRDAVINAAVANTQNLADKIFTLYHGAGLGNGPGGLVVGGALAADQLTPAQDPSITIEHLKTMRTSTGRDYLIVASSIKAAAVAGGMVPGGGAAAGERAGVYFIPIMGEKAFDANKTKAAEWQIGKVAQAAGDAILSGGAAVAVAANTNTQILDAAASRGALPTLAANTIFEGRTIGFAALANVNNINNIDDIQDMQVIGDSVLLSFARSDLAADNQMHGVYQTTAIFDNDGKIVKWTPLQRINGAATQTQAGRIDPVSGNIMYLSDRGTVFNETDWDSNQPTTIELQKLIASNFPAEKGGVRSIQTFDDETPSFDQRNLRRGGGALRVNKMALTVVLGDEKVMVVQTLKNNRPARHFYDNDAAVAEQNRIAALPVAQRAAATTAAAAFVGEANPTANVFVFANDALKSIAPLTCAEVLRINVAVGADLDLGYLYVGGYKGVCRLQTAAGAGWRVAAAASLVPTGLNDFGAFADPAVLGRATFVRLNNPALKDVVKIVSAPARDGNARALMGVVMNDSILATDATVANVVVNLQLQNVATVVRIDLSAVAPVFDGVLLRDFQVGGGANDNAYAILATAGGLLVQNVVPGGVVAPVALDGTDIPLQLAYVPLRKGGLVGGDTRANGGAGMLYVLAGDQANGNVKLYRFEAGWHANANQVLTRVGNGVPLTYDAFRRYFATDGYKFFTGHDAALDTSDMFNLRTMTNSATSLPLTAQALGNMKLGDFLTAPVRDAVTGAWMVAGSFGMTAND